LRLPHNDSAKITNDSSIVGNELIDELYSDLTVRYRFLAQAERCTFTVTAGIDILFDNKPPKTGSPFESIGTGYETACDVYDILGRAHFVALRVNV